MTAVVMMVLVWLGFAAVTVRLVWICAIALKSGRYNAGRGVILGRSQNPLFYWGMTISNGLVACGFVWMLATSAATFGPWIWSLISN